MPFGDGTGPMGAGPRTGRAAGYCAGFSTPGYLNPYGRYGYGYGRGWGRGFGRGFGRGWGRGLGFRWGWNVSGFYPYSNPLSPKEESDILRNEVKVMEENIKNLNKRIAELEKEEDK